MEQWKQFIGKKTKVIFNDGDYPKKKVGLISDVTDTHVILQTHERTEALNLNKIDRMELMENGKKENQD